MNTSKSTSLEPDLWIQRYGDAMYAFALSRLRDATSAEEVVQETYTAGLSGASRYQGQSSERTWLFGILKHKIIDQIRKRSRERPSDEDFDKIDDAQIDQKGSWMAGPTTWLTNPDSAYEIKELRHHLLSCIGDLPGKQSDAFAMRELAQLEANDVCKKLDVSKTNLWVLLHRARLKLRQCLDLSMVS